jgi:putative addiction module component (TIGR02574 family)
LDYSADLSIDQLAPEALKLPTRERALLAASLWESIDDPYELPADIDDEAAVKLAQERDLAMENGQVAAVSHDEMMRRVRK